MVSIEDVDGMFRLLLRQSESAEQIKQTLMVFARECAKSGYLAAACSYFERALSLSEAAGEKAACLLALGQTLERSGDYTAALAAYTRAFELPQEPNDIWYFLNNNRAYCLNQKSMHVEAEERCLDAIRINGERHNAHKNLGIALQGRRRYAQAARSFMRAVQLCPADGRALALLKRLVVDQHVIEEAPEVLASLNDGRETVQ